MINVQNIEKDSECQLKVMLFIYEVIYNSKNKKCRRWGLNPRPFGIEP